MSTSASPGPDPLRDDQREDHDGVDDVGTASAGTTGPGPDSTRAGAAPTAPTAGSGQGGVNTPDTGPGPAAADVDGGDDHGHRV